MEKEIYDEVIKCNRCGFCQQVCPVYRVTLKENDVARGRNQILRFFVEGKIESIDEIKDSLYNCLFCKACVLNCFPEVATDKLILNLREAYLKKQGIFSPQKFIFNYVLKSPKFMNVIFKSLYLGKKTYLSKIFKSDKLIEKVPFRNLRERYKVKKKSKLGYFVGCGINYLLPEVGLATIDLLDKFGVDVQIVDNICCGFPAYVYGDVVSAKRMIQKNIEIFNESGIETLITDCASCSFFLKEYKKITPELKFTADIKDVTEFILGLDIKEKKMYGGKRVTYHSPCHLSRGQNIKIHPPEVLKKLKTIEFVELPEGDMCCGGAGSYSIFYSDLSKKILHRKIDNVKKTKAEILITACPSCIVQLKYGMKEFGLNVEVLHISEFLDINS